MAHPLANEIKRKFSWILKTQDHRKIIAIMLSGISITKPLFGGASLLDIARETCYPEMKMIPIYVMLNYCSMNEIDPKNERDLCPLFTAIELGSFKFVYRWVNAGFPLNVHYANDRTPLLVATFFSVYILSAKIIQYLILNGADPCVKTEEGVTPLQFMVSRYRGENMYRDFKLMIFLLLRAGANINCQDSKGRTPLHLAKMNRNYSCMFDLLQFGADINVFDDAGLSVMDYIFFDLTMKGCFNESSDESVEAERNCYESIRILMYHIIKMNVVGLYVDEKVNSRFQDLRVWFDKVSKNKHQLLSRYYKRGNLSMDDIDQFTEKCKAERTKLKNMKLVDYYSMYDIILISDLGMYKVLKNNIFEEYFSSGKHRDDFPIYWYFLQLRYNAGLVRREIQQLGEDCFERLNLDLPSTCSHYIDHLFTNEELVDFIEVTSSMDIGIPKHNLTTFMLLDEKQFNLRVPGMSDFNRNWLER